MAESKNDLRRVCTHDARTADVDPSGLAARFGRQAVAGVEVRRFEERGDAAPDGKIWTFGAKRYVQVAHTASRYLSAAYFEEVDHYGQSPGRYYDWSGVEVEPTAVEKDAEATGIQAKLDAEAAEKQRKSDALARAAAAEAAFTASVADLVCVSVRPQGAIEIQEEIHISKRVSVARFTLADGRTGWRREFRSDDARTYYYLPADAADAACLYAAECAKITPEAAVDWLAKYADCPGNEIYRAAVSADAATQDRLRAAATKGGPRA